MKAFHSTNSESRIDNFDLSKAGLNTISNLNSDNAFRIAGCFLGIWFSMDKIDGYKYAHEYDVNDSDYMVLNSLDELEAYMYEEIQNIEEVSAYDLFRDPDRLIDLSRTVRDNIIANGYTGVSITHDEEFDGNESLIAIDLTTIK